MNEQDSKTTLEEAPDTGAFSMYDMSSPFDDEPDFEVPGADSKDESEDDSEAKEGKGDSGTDEVEIDGEKVSRETLTELLSLQKEALEDEVLKPWLTGDDPVGLVEMARIGASNASTFERATNDPEASYALVGEVLALHFKHHGDDEEMADESALDLLHSIKHPNTLDPAARPFYEAAKAVASHARELSAMGKDLVQQLKEATQKIAEYEQGPELLKALKAKVPDAEIAPAELKQWMDRVGTKSPAVAYKAYLAEQEEAKEAKGIRQAEPKTPNQPKSSGGAKTFVDTGDPDRNFELAAKGFVMVKNT